MEERENLALADTADEQPVAEATPIADTVVPTEPKVETAPAECSAEAPAEETPAAPEPSVAPAVTAVPPATPVAKKANSKKALLIVGIAAVAAIAIFLAIFFMVIQPNIILADARAALDDKEFTECADLLERIPNHKETPALQKELDLAVAKSYIKEGELDDAEDILAKYPGDKDAKALNAEIEEARKKQDLDMAKDYIDEGELDSAESILAKYPGDEDAKKIRADLQYARASELVDQQKYDDAKLILDKIPEHEDPKDLRKHISYATALDVLESGDYKTAYTLFQELGDFKDAAEQKEIVYYEALAFKSLLAIQPTLKNPASLRVTKVTFHKHPTTSGELNAIYEISASNSYGGSVGAFAYDVTLYDGESGTGMISKSSYSNPSSTLDKLYVLLVDTISKQTVHPTTVDVARMNRLLAANASFNIDLPFQSGAVADN